MPDAFFANSKKRKRDPSGINSKPYKPLKKPKFSQPSTSKQKKRKDEELSSGESSLASDDDNRRDGQGDANLSGEEDARETAAEKRLRLARVYLESVKNELGEGEFDAAELDREIISSRLQQDVLEHSGKIHKFIGDKIRYNPASTSRLVTRGHRLTVTSAVASENGRHLFTCGKEGDIFHWDLATGKQSRVFKKSLPKKGQRRQHHAGEDINGHSGELWTLALSSDGQYLASGGKDRHIGVWDVEKGIWVKGFKGHKDSICGLAFRKGSHQLYSASHDRSVKLFDLSVMGYVETLFGHQDRISDVDALRGETAITSGSRDKTVRYWKIADETQIVFRGGAKSLLREMLEGGDVHDGEEGEKSSKKGKQNFVEGSMECVAMLDETTFLSGGDSGTISLWTTTKKKPIYNHQLAHGFTQHHSKTGKVVINPRWITALAALAYSDLFASGSWDGFIRLWRLSSNLKSFEAIADVIPISGVINSLQLVQVPTSAVANARWYQAKASGEKANGVPANINGKSSNGSVGSGKKVILVVAAVGRETRTGRWLRLGESEIVKNCGLVVPLEIGS